jgi:predicted metal-dependent peptidase
MSKMVRKQLFISDEQNRRIKARAAATGKSEGEVIRRGIDRELDDKTAEAEGDWKDAWRQAAGIWKDYDEIDELMLRRRKRRRKRRVETLKIMRGK